jgi:protein SCO1/2
MDGRLTHKIRRLAVVAAGTFGILFAACGRQPDASRTYPLRGQVISVHTDRQHITVKHEDVVGLMPGMTMSFPVARAELLQNREPGELIVATLEVTGTVGRLTTIERTGFEKLPADSNAAEMAGNVLDVGDELPEAAFVDDQDRRRAISEWRGSVVLLTFIYTRCPLPNYCPLMDRHFASLQASIAGDAKLAGTVRLVSISFDPDYDTPAILAAHAKRYKADPAIWTFLTGDRVTVDRFAARLGVGLIRPAGAQEITHNLRTALVGADGRIKEIFTGNEWTPAKALEAIRAAVGNP